MWSYLAVKRTKECAERAGMGEVRIVAEPEAAAIWSLQELTPETFSIGDIFIVCNARGGTVDLISYRVSRLNPILRVAEVAPSHGKTCGSTFLNRRFEALLRSKLEDHPNWDEDLMEDVGVQARAIQYLGFSVNT